MALASQSTMAAIRLGDATLKPGALSSPWALAKGPDAPAAGEPRLPVLCALCCAVLCCAVMCQHMLDTGHVASIDTA